MASSAPSPTGSPRVLPEPPSQSHSIPALLLISLRPEQWTKNLIIFAALVLVAQFAGKTNVATALGAQLFFWSRLAYAPAYVIGIPWLRTGLWGVSFVGLLQILLQLL